MRLEEVKEYLRVDFTDDDSMITTMMTAAEGYITAAVGAYDDFNNRAKMLFLAVVQDLYDNRSLTVTEQQRKRMSYMYSSIILQLQLEDGKESECDGTRNASGGG